MEYSYKKDNLNSDLVAFIENVIFPEYEKNEKAPQRNRQKNERQIQEEKETQHIQKLF